MRPYHCVLHLGCLTKYAAAFFRKAFSIFQSHYLTLEPSVLGLLQPLLFAGLTGQPGLGTPAIKLTFRQA